jgi:phosphoenolpyruvate-protein kinase (PTS system EI component)
MFPMVSELAELRAARAALEEAHRALDASGTPHAWPIPAGIMIEVPSAALLADQLAAEADFFSIGTNDLTQYLLAADRGHPALARFQDALHPAVLRTIAQLTTAAHQLGRLVAVCGEAASDPISALALVGLGVEELSLTPGQIPAIKSTLRAASKRELEALAGQALEMSSPVEVRTLFERAIAMRRGA